MPWSTILFIFMKFEQHLGGDHVTNLDKTYFTLKKRQILYHRYSYRIWRKPLCLYKNQWCGTKWAFKDYGLAKFQALNLKLPVTLDFWNKPSNFRNLAKFQPCLSRQSCCTFLVRSFGKTAYNFRKIISESFKACPEVPFCLFSWNLNNTLVVITWPKNARTYLPWNTSHFFVQVYNFIQQKTSAFEWKLMTWHTQIVSWQRSCKVSTSRRIVSGPNDCLHLVCNFPIFQPCLSQKSCCTSLERSSERTAYNLTILSTESN